MTDPSNDPIEDDIEETKKEFLKILDMVGPEWLKSKMPAQSQTPQPTATSTLESYLTGETKELRTKLAEMEQRLLLALSLMSPDQLTRYRLPPSDPKRDGAAEPGPTNSAPPQETPKEPGEPPKRARRPVKWL